MIKVNKDIFMMKQFYSVKSINRVRSILDNIDVVDANVAQVEGDTVVYIKNANNIITGDFIGKRIYLQILYVKEGTITVEYNKKNELTKLSCYNMVRDEITYGGKGKEVIINENEIAIFELDEALEIKQIESSKYFYIVASKYGGIK